MQLNFNRRGSFLICETVACWPLMCFWIFFLRTPGEDDLQANSKEQQTLLCMCRIFGEKASVTCLFPLLNGARFGRWTWILKNPGQHVDRQQVGYDLVFRLGKVMWEYCLESEILLFLKHDIMTSWYLRILAFFATFLVTVVERESADGGGNCNLAPLNHVGFCPSFLSMLFCQGMERDQSYLWCGLSKSSQVRNRSDLFSDFFLDWGGFFHFWLELLLSEKLYIRRTLMNFFSEPQVSAESKGFFHRCSFFGPGMKGQSCRILSRWCAQQPTELSSLL